MERIDVLVPGQRGVFEGWIRDRGGVAIWENVNLSDPGAGFIFTPAMKVDGISHMDSPRWSHRFRSTINDISRFRFVSGMRVVNEFPVKTRIGAQGLSVKLTDASTRRVHKACDAAEKEYKLPASYHFNYDLQTVVIEVPKYDEEAI